MYRVLVFNSSEDAVSNDAYTPCIDFDFSDMDELKEFVSEMIGHGKACIVYKPTEQE